ncbi:meiosis protein SPO22/ZIP4 like-domain-containing protein [Crucibulum laeve]|uniref:Meiosis protein SPO22/ZIP4 like-domain-containing protein n=1 Tax=Crucibulum laeve TaxID=68775 RepID=A0A5C3M088_9AGAR|nr:meiosis protein SPO22/ZIP4 like-domain-containing protein [Crucibulum laeve]
MTMRKKKNVLDLQQTYESIMELLATIKPLLDDPKHSNRPSVVEDLEQVASLAESFIEQRPRSNKSWSHLADALDQEGVNLWNISGLVRSEDDGRTLIASLRLAAFRLVEAGLETKPGIDSLLHVLQLASKTGATLSQSGNNVVAGTVLTSAAKFEELLRNADDADGTHRQAIACATIVYLSSRMEAAWREGNYTVADFMSHKISNDADRLSLLPPHVRELLAFKLHQIGKSMLKGTDEQDRNRAVDAVEWLQKAFSMADQLEDTAAPGVAELKISILRTMARAYFLSRAYDRAEAALEELVPTIDASTDHASSEYQELRWLRLAILKKRKAGDAALLDAFKSIIDHMELSETSITDVLQDLRTLSHQYFLVTAVHQYCIDCALRHHGTEQESVDRLLLSLIFHCAKDEDHTRAMNTLEAAFSSVSEAEVELPSVPTTACLTLIWQYGDRHYHAKRWSQAADWYLAGSHELFRKSSLSTSSKCFRKAALCHIEQREYAKASTVIRRCPTSEATTHYVIFLTAIHQGLEDEAIRAMQDMQKTPDFDRKMLLLATQISHQSEMKTVLLTVLEALLKTLKVGTTDGEAVVEAMTLIRCIIKLALKLLVEPIANMPLLIDTVVNHFRTARILTEAASAQKAVSLIFKDVSWLWRTAYNCAVQGCSEWEHCEERISELFDISRDLLEACCQASPVDVDAELCLHLINASFASVSGRVFSLREAIQSNRTVDKDRLYSIAADIKASKNKIVAVVSKNKIQDDNDRSRVQYFIHVLQVFEAEFLVQLKDWDQVSQIVAEIVNSGPLAVGTFEAIADILWVDKDCPINVLYGCLEAILRASLDHSSLSVEKFARWLRAICTIILARNTPADRVKAIGYVEQALTVMEENDDSDEPYPMDERQWLLGTAYNTGTECLHASLLDEAKRWFEASTVICRFVPGGKERAKKISETYMHLLSRYTSKG